MAESFKKMEDPLAKTRIVIEGKEVITNEFGGYAVRLPGW
ncbi:hypothetical protein DMNBHIDG_02256 [Candidatus Methanoperedenaceae archaeon GB37]|nr:hypothetical protein DMNBHIDG_02256 [Candidatus Methanoperedenaceae archaeon GB37]